MTRDEIQHANEEVRRLKEENDALHAECDRLTAMLGPQKVLRADDVTEAGFYWAATEGQPWIPCIIVRLNEVDDELALMIVGSPEVLPLKGNVAFIGPIKMPEVQK